MGSSAVDSKGGVFGLACRGSIALFGVLVVAAVDLLVDSIFLSPRLWLFNGR